MDLSAPKNSLFFAPKIEAPARKQTMATEEQVDEMIALMKKMYLAENNHSAMYVDHTKFGKINYSMPPLNDCTRCCHKCGDVYDDVCGGFCARCNSNCIIL